MSENPTAQARAELGPFLRDASTPTATRSRPGRGGRRSCWRSPCLPRRSSQMNISGSYKSAVPDAAPGCRCPPQILMYRLPCKPISSVPKLANRTPFAVVIDSFLVRTANYGIGDRDGSHLMLSNKFKHLAGNVWIGTDVATIHFPVA